MYGEKISNDCNMDKGKVVIQNDFTLVNNRWWIQRHFNSKVDGVTKVATCCVLHNFCETWNELEPLFANLGNR